MGQFNREAHLRGQTFEEDNRRGYFGLCDRCGGHIETYPGPSGITARFILARPSNRRYHLGCDPRPG